MKQLLTFCILIFGFSIYAQEPITNTETIIYQGKKHINSNGEKLSFAFDNNDHIKLTFNTEKGKNLKSVTLKSLTNKTIWESENSTEASAEISIPKEGVYTFEFDAKSLGSRDVFIQITRTDNKLYNPAWMPFNTYKKEIVNYSVDSVIGYEDPIIVKKEFKVFDRYLYQNVEVYNFHDQILGQAGIHNSQAKSYDMGLNQNYIPRYGKLKGYTYFLQSTLGGAKHWEIADVTVSVGALFLSPAAGFAAHGAMALVGPQPGNEPIQYFISNRSSDINVVKEIYSPTNEAKKGVKTALNAGKKVAGEIAGIFSKDTKNKINDQQVGQHIYSEDDLDYTQKGKVTNLFMYSAVLPTNNWFIMANPEYTQAKNVYMKGNAIFYAPAFKILYANELVYNLKAVSNPKSTYTYFKTTTYSSIKN